MHVLNLLLLDSHVDLNKVYKFDQSCRHIRTNKHCQKDIQVKQLR